MREPGVGRAECVGGGGGGAQGKRSAVGKQVGYKRMCSGHFIRNTLLGAGAKETGRHRCLFDAFGDDVTFILRPQTNQSHHISFPKTPLALYTFSLSL